MPVEISVLAGREPELEWLGKAFASARIPRSPVQHLHIHGPKGVGISSLLHAFLESLKADGFPTVAFRFAGMFRFAPLPDCVRAMLRDPLWIGVTPGPGYREVEATLLTVIERRRRKVLADGGVILYHRGGGNRLAADKRLTTSGGLSFRRSVSTALPGLWLEACKGADAATGTILLIFEQWRSNPAEFEDWVASELSEAIRRNPLPWPLLLLTTGRTALHAGGAGGGLVFPERFEQKAIPPLPRNDFFSILEEHGYERAAWDWLFAECQGIPGSIVHAWERWNRHQSVHRSAQEALVSRLPASFRRPVGFRETLWIQAAAAFAHCDEESLALVLGRREASQAAAYLRSIPTVRVVSGAFLLDPGLRNEIVSWMKEHHPSFLDECERGAALLRSLDELVPRHEDRGFLSALAPVKEFDNTLLEAVFPG